MRMLSFLTALGVCTASFAQDARPNVLLIAVDDLNDWVGALGGHPQAMTPNMDRLAGMSTNFVNAHCQAPVCNPSRTSLMTSRYPSSTGVYFLNPEIHQSPLADQAETLPMRFAREGYEVFAAGKLFHAGDNEKYFPTFAGNFGGFGPRPEEKISQPHGHPLWDWGAFPDNTQDMPDNKIADWAVEQLAKEYDKPFFMGVGFFRPHVPMYAPQEWFDRHPRGELQLPVTLDTDRDDIPQYGLDLTTLEHVAPTHEWVSGAGEWDHAVQAYLASVTFVDMCVGKVLDALESGPHARNTIIVLFSDHGFHLGEKQRWAKRSLWEDGTRVPMMFHVPGIAAADVKAPAELIDIYPTLLELCGMDVGSTLEGHSLSRLIEDPHAIWAYPARTTFGPGNHAIRTQRWRYIHYADGSEELYDHDSDPDEWRNLAGVEGYESILANLRKHLPTNEAAILGEGSTGHLAFRAAEANRAK